MELPLRRKFGLILTGICFIIIIQTLQGSAPSRARRASHAAEVERNALDVLSKSQHGDFNPELSRWVNITGLRADEGLAWHLLTQVRKITRHQTQAVLGAEWIQTRPDETIRLRSGVFGDRYSSVDHLDQADARITATPFFKNITGHVHGDWIRHIDDHREGSKQSYANTSNYLYFGDDFSRNITGQRGHMHLRLDERQDAFFGHLDSTIRILRAELSIEDSSGDNWDVPLRGLHFTESGSAVLTTNSERYHGLLALPYLLRSENQFRQAQEFFSRKSKTEADTKVGAAHSFLDSWQSIKDMQDEMFPMPQCDYLVYLQQHLVWPFQLIESHVPANGGKESGHTPGASYLDSLETELRKPTGMLIDFVPPLKFSATIFSPDCGFILESSGFPDNVSQTPGIHLRGDKIEAILSRIRILAMIYGLTIVGQVVLLTRQIKDSSTPSTRSRVSYYTIAIMVMADCGMFTTSLLFGALVPGLYLPIVTVSFFLFLCVPFFGLRFLVDVWTVQAPEREERERQRVMAAEASGRSDQDAVNGQAPFSNSTPTVIITPAGADLLPLPVTARRPNDQDIQVILPPDQDIDAMMAEDDLLQGPGSPTGMNTPHRRFNLGIKVLFLSFALTILSYVVSLWPTTIRSIYTNIVLFCYLSFWIPQIRRNMLRNCRKALRWEFVVGQSILRLTPIAYFYVYEGNILSIANDPYAFAAFAAWQWAQILLLLSQDILGPRFFLPAGILPPAYDYHQVLREGDEEDGGFMPIGFAHDGMSATGESKDRGKWLSDCIICMNPLEADYVPRGGDSRSGSASAAAVANMFARREYMITPCRHIFHSQCLDGWMKYKLQCPICRETLPPL